MTIKHNTDTADVLAGDTAPSVQDTQEAPQAPQDGPEDTATQDDTVESPEAADGAENTPEEDAENTSEDTSEEDANEMDDLKQRYAALEAKLAELEAKEAARLEAEAKAEALTTAGIKGDYGQLLHGDQETWAEQIETLKAFAAENAPAISVPRDPALDADLEGEEEEITAEEFLTGKHNIL